MAWWPFCSRTSRRYSAEKDLPELEAPEIKMMAFFSLSRSSSAKSRLAKPNLSRWWYSKAIRNLLTSRKLSLRITLNYSRYYRAYQGRKGRHSFCFFLYKEMVKNNAQHFPEIGVSYVREKLIMYAVIIVGAGPAGIFTALELLKQGSKKKILMVEKGHPIETRRCPKGIRS